MLHIKLDVITESIYSSSRHYVVLNLRRSSEIFDVHFLYGRISVTNYSCTLVEVNNQAQDCISLFIPPYKTLLAVTSIVDPMATSISSLASRKRLRENDTKGPAFKLRRTSQSSSDSQDRIRETDSPKPAVKHSKKERKQNPSSRVHSLRKLLARGNLPSNIQQEKERELAALLHDQERTKTKKEAKKVLEKYHYVRFVERQKAEKRIKKLRKQLQLNGEDEVLKRKIHEMEVNRNYAIYAPLDQKYVSIFAGNQEGDGLSQNSSMSKPAIWYVVEEIMHRGKSELEALRDGKVKSNSMSIKASNSSQQVNPYARSTNMDSRDASKQKEKSRLLMIQQGEGHKEVHSLQEEPSDEDAASDGGFFER